MSIAESLSRIEAFLSEKAPSVLSKWGKGLSAAEIDRLLEDIPLVLSEPVRELYQWHNGSGNRWIAVIYPLLSLEDAIEKYKILAALEESWEQNAFPLFASDRDILFVDIAKEDSPVWFRFLGDGSTEVFWSSITVMMQTVADAFEMGAFQLENE